MINHKVTQERLRATKHGDYIFNLDLLLYQPKSLLGIHSFCVYET